MAIKVNSTTVIDNDRKGTLEGIDLSGLLAEEYKRIPSASYASNSNVDLAEGMIHFYQAVENTTAAPNIRYNASTTLNSVLPVDKAITLTIIIAASTSRYIPGLTIDGGNQSVNWIGGSAPTEGGSSGVDIYTYNILKTGDNTYTVIGSVAKTSA